eukprot:11169415-Lingulodinium_polyedra.AAC.1
MTVVTALDACNFPLSIAALDEHGGNRNNAESLIEPIKHKIVVALAPAIRTTVAMHDDGDGGTRCNDALVDWIGVPST